MPRLVVYSLFGVVLIAGAINAALSTEDVPANDDALLNLFIRDIVTDEMIAEQVNTSRKYDFRAKLPASALVGGREA